MAFHGHEASPPVQETDFAGTPYATTEEEIWGGRKGIVSEVEENIG